MQDDIITIDGPSASGKSTLAKRLARKLGIYYLDSGAIYRTIGVYLQQQNLDPQTDAQWDAILVPGTLKLVYTDHHVEYFFHGIETTTFLRHDEIALIASRIAKEGKVRAFVNGVLREVAAKGSFIADGRDLGTAVFPNARIKFFITASVEARAKRREHELVSLGVPTNFDKVYEQLLVRDEQDRNRKIDPLKAAEDAIFIDTTEMTTDEVAARMLCVIKKKCGIQPNWLQRTLCHCLRFFFKTFYRLRILGEAHKESLYGGVVYANHTSYLDAPLLLATLGPRLVFVAHERVIQKNFCVRLLTSFFPLILVDEKNMPRDFFATCRHYMREGMSVVIFPEGMRGDGKELLEFQEGLAAMVHICRAQQILPVYLGGVYNAWPKGRWFPRFRKIVVLISKSIHIIRFGDQFTADIRKRLTQQLKIRLKELEKHYKEDYEQ